MWKNVTNLNWSFNKNFPAIRVECLLYTFKIIRIKTTAHISFKRFIHCVYREYTVSYNITYSLQWLNKFIIYNEYIKYQTMMAFAYDLHTIIIFNHSK